MSFDSDVSIDYGDYTQNDQNDQQQDDNYGYDMDMMLAADH